MGISGSVVYAQVIFMKKCIKSVQICGFNVTFLWIKTAYWKEMHSMSEKKNGSNGQAKNITKIYRTLLGLFSTALKINKYRFTFSFSKENK